MDLEQADTGEIGLISIPKAVEMDITLLKTDGHNPNKMTEEQIVALMENIKKFGFIIPVVTNSDLVVADGEQRLEAARRLGMKKVPIICLQVRDVDRRILRQVLNKLKGTHDIDLDSYEFQQLVSEGEEENIRRLLAMDKEDIEAMVNIQIGDATNPLDEDEIKTLTATDTPRIVICPDCGKEIPVSLNMKSFTGRTKYSDSV